MNLLICVVFLASSVLSLKLLCCLCTPSLNCCSSQTVIIENLLFGWNISVES